MSRSTRTDVDEVYQDGKVVKSTARVVDVTAEVTEADLRARARRAITVDRAYLALATPTAAQNTAQVRALTRQVIALTRLTVATELLDDDVID